MIIQKIYWTFPPIIKDIAASFKGYIFKKKRFNSHYHKILSEIDNQQFYDLKEIEEYQLQKLKKLALEVLSFTPFYQPLISKDKDVLSKIRSANTTAEVLELFPMITKKELVNNPEDLINKNSVRKVVEVAKTSGTTGTPVTTYYDAESIGAAFAMWKRFHNWIGLPEKSFRKIRFSGNQIVAPDRTAPPFWVNNFTENQLLMSAYHISEHNAEHYISKIRSFQPKLIDGYPSSIKVLSKYINDNNISFPEKPLAIVTTAETLTKEDREIIEKAFGCKVYNQYASSDGAPFITECPYGSLHLNIDTGVFEFLNEDGMPAKSGELAELVVTSFRSYKSPKIRFRIGDWVKLSDSQRRCGCGSSFPAIDKIIGRTDDLVYGVDGRRVGMFNYNLLKYSIGLKEAQIQQTELGKIKILIVRNNDYRAEREEKLIKERAEILLGKGIRVEFIYCNQIPLGSRGKFKSVICKVDPAHLQNI